MIPQGPVYGLPSFLLLSLGKRILFQRGMVNFGFQLAVTQPARGFDLAALQHASNRAPRLVMVRAIPEPAVSGNVAYILEDTFERILARPKLQLAHPRVIDDRSASRERQQHAVRCCMPAS